MRQLYLAATGQNRGKTTAALGLLDGFVTRGLRTGFIKPVGQRTVIEDGVPADEDAVLMQETFGLPEPYTVMSPVHIPRGFTKAYIAGEVVEDLGARIVAAHASYRDHEILLIEGTGHAGVGAVIGLSNAVVAADARDADDHRQRGRRRPADRRDRPQRVAVRARTASQVAGAIVNKVDLDAQPGIADGPRARPRARTGSRCSACCRSGRSSRTRRSAMILEGVHGETIHPGPDLDRVIDGVAIGAMEPGHMLERVGPGTLVIVPGDREDVILTLTTAHLALRLQRANARRGGPDRADRGRRDERGRGRRSRATRAPRSGSC